MHFKKQDLWTIPNLIGYMRIILIPFIIYYYIHDQFMISAMLLLISTASDLVDGTIARHCNMVTDLGKILDPIADKLTHAALAICLAFRYRWMRALLLLMIGKESYMAYKGIQNLKQGKMMDGAFASGKVCTASLFIGILILFLFPNIDIKFANTIIGILMIIMSYTWIFYIRYYHKEEHHA